MLIPEICQLSQASAGCSQCALERNDQKLHFLGLVPHVSSQLRHVGRIKCGINLIQDKERRWLKAEIVNKNSELGLGC